MLPLIAVNSCGCYHDLSILCLQRIFACRRGISLSWQCSKNPPLWNGSSRCLCKLLGVSSFSGLTKSLIISLFDPSRDFTASCIQTCFKTYHNKLYPNMHSFWLCNNGERSLVFSVFLCHPFRTETTQTWYLVCLTADFTLYRRVERSANFHGESSL